jgi:hypothetical protein
MTANLPMAYCSHASRFFTTIARQLVVKIPVLSPMVSEALEADQLQIILIYRTASQASNLDRTYRPILDRLLINQTEPQKEILIKEFQIVVAEIRKFYDSDRE